MPLTESMEAAINLDDLETPGRPPSGWEPSASAGHEAVTRAVRSLFAELGAVTSVVVEPTRAVVHLKVRRARDEARKLVDKGAALGASGKFGASIETLARAVRSDPANVGAHYNLGVAYLEKGDIAAAGLSFSRAVALARQPSPEMLLGLGNVALRRGDVNLALDRYRRALRLQPGSALIERNLGSALARVGQFEAAEDVLRESLSHDPSSAEAMLGLGMVLARAGKPDAAAEYLRSALKRVSIRSAIATQARSELREIGEDVDEPQRSAASAAAGLVVGDRPRLLPATEQLLHEVAERTGADFEFVERPDLTPRAAIQIARGGMRHHRILFRPGLDPIDYVVAHESGHIVRLWTVPEERRRLPVATRDLKVAAIHQLGDELTYLANTLRMQPELIAKLFDMLYPGTIRQVTNFPIDIRIERWIYGTYPDLRDAQRASLINQLDENRQVLSRDFERTTPKTVFRASNVMNCAFAIAVAELYQDPRLSEPCVDTEYWLQGQQLLGLLGQAPDNADGDVLLVDSWAEALHVRGWYRWGILRDLPPGDAMVAA